MAQDIAHLTITVTPGRETDVEELSELTTQLRRRLLEMDVEGVALLRPEEAPPGTKSAEAVAIGALVVTLVKTPVLLAAVTDAVRTWLEARKSCSAKLTLDGDTVEFTGISRHDQRVLVEAFVERHMK